MFFSQHHIKLIVLFMLLSTRIPAQQAWLTPPSSMTGQSGQAIECIFQTTSAPEWITFFIKSSEESDYSALQVTQTAPNQFIVSIPQERTLSGDLQYYFIAKTDGTVHYFPADAPQSVLHISVLKDGGKIPTEPSSSAAPAPPSLHTRLSINFSGGADVSIRHKDPDFEPEFNHQHAMSLQLGMNKDDFQLSLQTRLAYSGQDFNNGDKVDLSQLTVSIQMDHHLLELGDQNFYQSEFTISGMGRRGILYKHEGIGLQWQAFALNSQQLVGFRGFGLPKKDLGLFGGLLGYKQNEWQLNLLYLSGKDDPAEGSNNAFSPAYSPREGSLISLFGNLQLFRQQLSCSSEIAFSRHDDKLDDGLGAENGMAWKTELQGQIKSWSIHAFYHDIDKAFNSIGQLYFTNDRRQYGANSSLQLSQNISWGVSYHSEYSGSDSQTPDPLTPYHQTILSQNTQVSSSLSLMVSGKLNLSLMATKSWQEARQNNLILPDGAIDRIGLTLGLNWTFAKGSALFINSNIDQIYSEKAPEREGKSLNAQLGGTFSSGEGFSLNPSFSFARQENPQSGEIATIWGSTLSGRMNFFTRFISLDLMGSYNHMEMSQVSSSNFMVDGGLSLESADLLKFARLAFSLRGAYLFSETDGLSINDYRIYLRGDYSIL